MQLNIKNASFWNTDYHNSLRYIRLLTFLLGCVQQHSWPKDREKPTKLGIWVKNLEKN